MCDDIDKHDHHYRRCPILGHEVPFSYCRSPAAELPCRRVFDCWWQTFEVEAFIRGHFTEEEIEQILAPRQDKRVTLVELIEKARKAKGPERDDG